MWQRLVGSAVEHAARCLWQANPDKYPQPEQTGDREICDREGLVDFKSLFLSSDAEDEEATNLGEMLGEIQKWRGENGFKAAELAEILNQSAKHEDEDGAELSLDPSQPSSKPKSRRYPELADIAREFLFPKLPQGARLSFAAVGKRLKAHVSRPVVFGNQTLVLHTALNPHTKVMLFHVAKL
jgi:hypothetical protein